jgi:hypothetical protein
MVMSVLIAIGLETEFRSLSKLYLFYSLVKLAFSGSTSIRPMRPLRRRLAPFRRWSNLNDDLALILDLTLARFL